MSKYDLVLFDLDGTLTDPREGITKSIQYALAKFGIIEHDLDNLVKFIGPPLKDSFMKYYSFDERQAWQAVLAYREYFAVKGIFQNAVYEGIPHLLHKLKETGKKLVVATAKPTVYSEKIVEHFGLAGYFSLVAGSNLDGTRVVKAEVIRYALDEVNGGVKSGAVMVGDREHDICGARENGIDSIAVTFGYGPRAELEAAHPTYLAASVGELGKILCGHN